MKNVTFAVLTAAFAVLSVFATDTVGSSGLSDAEIAGRIVRWAGFGNVGPESYRRCLQQCGYDTNRLCRVAREVYETNENSRVRSQALALFWTFGGAHDRQFLESCVVDPKCGEYALRVLRRIEGVCSNSVDQLVRFHALPEGTTADQLRVDKGIAFRSLAEEMMRTMTGMPLRRYFANAVPTCVSNNITYAWMSDRGLMRMDETYRNSKRRLALLRYALPYQTNVHTREAMTSAINELVAYPESNLPD